ARLSSLGLAPRRNSSASGAAKCLAPTAVSPIPASAMASPSSHRATPAAPTGQSPPPRPTFSYAVPPPGRTGNLISAGSVPAPDRAPDLGEQFPGADHRLVRRGVELPGRHGPGAARVADDHGRLERGERGRQVLGRIRLAQRAADRAPAAYHRIGDDLLRVV